MHRLGVKAQPNAVRATQPLQLVEKHLCNHTFSVIAHNDGVRVSEPCFQCGNHSSSGNAVAILASLPIQTNQLLLVSDDARLYASMPTILTCQTTTIHALVCQQSF